MSRPATATPPPATPGERVKAARLEAGLTLAVLAERMQSSPMAISKVELGHKAPTLDWLYRLAVVLQCPASAVDPRFSDVVPAPTVE